MDGNSALRYEGLIPADDPDAIDLIVEQKKVRRGQVGTSVEIKQNIRLTD